MSDAQPSVPTPVRAPARTRGRPLRRLFGDRQGATLVEFALVSLPFFGLMIAILQTSLVFFAQQALDTAAEKAVRPMMTGSLQKSGTTAAQFKTLACSKLPTLLKCANLMIDVQVASNFAAASTATPTITFDSAGNPNNVWSYTPGSSNQITIVRLMYVWNVKSGPLGFDLSTLSRGKRLLVSTSVFKAEIY